MSNQISITGRLGADPKTGMTRDGKPWTRLTLVDQRRRLNKDTNQWEDTTAPLWVSAFLTSRDALAAATLHKGDQATLTGTLEAQTYTDQNGAETLQLQIGYARYGGSIPKQNNTTPPDAPGEYQAPADSYDPWADTPGF